QGDKARERREQLAAASPVTPPPTPRAPRRTATTPTPESPSTPVPANPVAAPAPRGPASLELGGRIATVTNINGRVYENIKLQRADASGIIYTAEGGGGKIKLSDLPEDFLKELGVPAGWIQTSASTAANPAPKPRGFAA